MMLERGPTTTTTIPNRLYQLAVWDEVRGELMGGMWVYTREDRRRNAGVQEIKERRGNVVAGEKERRQKSEAGPGRCRAGQRLVMLAARDPTSAEQRS